MIEELPDIKAPWNKTYLFRKEPLLEYVWEVALKFASIRGLDPDEPDNSFAPCVFANRYAERNLTLEERYARHKEIYPTSYQNLEEYISKNPHYKPLNDTFKNEYLNNERLQNTIKAFGLDVSKLWYLLLFIYDYIEDLGTDAPIAGKTLKEEINEFCEQMEGATEIILKKNNRQCYDTEDKEHKADIIKFINSALDLYTDTYNKIMQDESENRHQRLKEAGMDYLSNINGFSADYNKTHTLKPTHKKFLFNEMIQYFMKDREATNFIDTKYRVSKDKWIFSSRLIYVVEYENIEGYNEDFDENNNQNRKLSNLLRRYNKENFPRVVHRYYW